jgi:hypothetical protein
MPGSQGQARRQMTGMVLAIIKAVRISLQSAPAVPAPSARDGLGRGLAGAPVFMPVNHRLKAP